ncbi:MAG: gamma-glutamyl-gamma-aminobutyrate hydrolase family protein [Caldilineaceae bacterium]|nr:gamma-glutamyl-gamma-aminobutyrate hydrolase family protein [Caldilineaceae bacterium]
MNKELRNTQHLPAQDWHAPQKRPLIGVPTGREKSQRFYGLPLYIMNQTYVRVLETLGALPVMIPLQMSEATLQGIFERLDGLFLPGGEDVDPSYYGAERHPQLGATDKERDRTELLLTRWALEAGMPFLGVCRGVQVLNVVCGGTLIQDLHTERPELDKHDYTPPTFERFRISHQVTVEPDSRLANALGTLHEVNSMHHQGIDQLGATLRVVARAEDGLAEALEVPVLPYVVGVQWHPEELATTDSHSHGLFHDFVYAAADDWRDRVPAGWQPQFTELCMAQEAARAQKLSQHTAPLVMTAT